LCSSGFSNGAVVIVRKEDIKNYQSVKKSVFKKNRKLAITLIELVLVVIILAILVVVAIPRYTRTMERSIDREAYANLSLILAAEKIYRMRNNNQYWGPIGIDSATDINSNLGLELNEIRFNYEIDASTPPTNPPTFAATAARTVGFTRTWSITQDMLEPQCSGCP
jgi:type II secretory pathway pseudopilin PulG